MADEEATLVEADPAGATGPSDPPGSEGEAEKVEPLRRIPIGELKLWDRNPRFITKERFDSLKKSMATDRAMMQARPLIALPDGRVIGGNMRLRAALELNWDDVETVVVHLSEEQAILWALRDNNPYGEYDDQGLSELLYELQQADIDLDLTGFSVDDIERIFDGAPPPPDDPPAPDDRGTDLALADVTVADPTHIVAAGEVWNVGPHLLVVAPVYDGWPQWIEFLEGDVLLVPYPTPTLPLTERAKESRLIMVQPDPWLAGHVLDKYSAVRGEEAISQLR